MNKIITYVSTPCLTSYELLSFSLTENYINSGHKYNIPEREIVQQVRSREWWIAKRNFKCSRQAIYFYVNILGTFDKYYNVTRDFYGRIIGRGNQVAGLVWNPKYNPLVKNM